MSLDFSPSVRWLDRHIDLILPHLETASIDRKLLQRAGEFAILYKALRGARGVPDDLLTRWQSVLTAYVNSQEIAEAARKSLPGAWAWLMPYFVLKHLHGHLVPEHEATMEFALRAGFPYASEVVPYRRLDQHYFLSLYEGRRLDPARFVPATALNTCRSLLSMDRDTAYSITHTLFYLNHFGRCQMGHDHPARGKVVLVLQSLLPHFARRGDWDVLGELLIVARCTEGFPSTTLDRYLALFQAQRDPGGYSPPSEATRQAMGDDPDRDRVFFACCHTTLVAALLDVAAPPDAEQVPHFELEPLGQENDDHVLRRVLEARNRAVLYLNAQSELGAHVPTFDTVVTPNGEHRDDIAGALGPDRNVVLYSLATHADPGLDDTDALDLAECFAREGDVEVVARLMAVHLAQRPLNKRLAAVLDYLLQSQKPDGSVGYFLRERRLLGVGDISNIRLGLTHLFVEAVEAWLDYRIAEGRSSGESVSQPVPAA
ncbi:MAG: hypothetical protein AAFP18_09900 [Bacteroidota bacterium]